MATTYRYGDRLVTTEPAPGLPDHLVRVLGPAPGDDGAPADWPGLSCDYSGCFEPDYVDILNGTSDELRPIYLDLKWDVCICQNCVDVGKHLDDDPAPADAESWRERAERAEATVAALRGALATAAGWCPRCKGRGGLAVRVGGETHHGDCPGCEAARAALRLVTPAPTGGDPR